MKIIALEEHFVLSELQDAWASLPTAQDDLTEQFRHGEYGEYLPELGDRRLRDMDDEGVDVQVLSINAPSVQNLSPEDALALARSANDHLAATIGVHPDRFQGFVTLPTPDPDAAVDELTRGMTQLGLQGAMLNGRTAERNIDHPAFNDLWSAAAQLKAPVYIHPHVPPKAVRDIYYSGLGPRFDTVFGAQGYGWHVETGIQLLRLIYSGAFDRNPDLQVIVGHWGELVLFFADRIQWLDHLGLNLDRTLHEYLTANVSYTPSGIFSQRYLRWALEVVGADRLMFATDYPFLRADAKNGRARSFLDDAPIDADERDKIAHANWEKLTSRVADPKARRNVAGAGVRARPDPLDLDPYSPVPPCRWAAQSRSASP